MFRSADMPVDEQHEKANLSAAVHEFGHVLGLDHPCDKKCVGPVMSCATCPTVSNCPTDPNYDNIVGIQLIYGWPDTSGGCEIGIAGPPGVIGRLQPPGPVFEDPSGLIPTDKPPNLIGFVSPALRQLPEAVDGGDVVAGTLNAVNRLSAQHVEVSGTLNTAGGAAESETKWLLDQTGAGDVVPWISPEPVKCLWNN